MRSAFDFLRRNWGVGLAGLVTLGLALAPWVRNRGLLRDFFDYGVMIVAAKRVADGARPYVDFLTPLQSLNYALSAWTEQLFGHSYQGLTLGNGVLIAVSVAGMMWLLLRWFSLPATAVLTTVLIVGSLSQHTLIWYNAIGVLTLAMIAWAGAAAPVWRREDRALHLVLALGLVLSGLNKLNYHGIGMAVALAWPLRAALLGKAGWGRAVMTMAGILVLGIVVPLALELAWTGATWEQWRYNVIDTAFNQRGGNLWAVFTWQFYFVPMHDYYHAFLRPLGAIFVGWLLVVSALAWRGRPGIDRAMWTGAAVIAILGMGGLTATNHEIGYIALAAGMALLVGLWLGFELPRRGWRPAVGLLLPAALLGAVFWHSAWLGQRTLFGHSESPRESYREVRGQGETFAYLRGTRIPPEMATDLEMVAEALGPATMGEAHPFFFATGVEWLERVWPIEPVRGLPILMAPLGYGQRELDLIKDEFSYPSRFKYVVGMQAWATWPGDLKTFVQGRSLRHRHGQFNIWELNAAAMLQGLPPGNDALGVINSFSGNLDGRLVRVEPVIRTMLTADKRSMLGLTEGSGGFRFEAPIYSLNGEVSLRRLDGAPLDEALTASFAVQIFDAETEETLGVPWTETFTLPAGEAAAVHRCEVNTFGRPMRFEVKVAEASAGKLAAGWLLPRLQHTASKTTEAPRLRLPSPGNVPAVDRAWREAIFPPEWVDDVELVVRNGHLTDRGVSIDRGGELWFHAKRSVAEWHGRFFAEAVNIDWNIPVPRVVWYNGGRIEILFQQGIPVGSDGTVFRAWSPEPDGWFGILVDGNDWVPGTVFRVEDMWANENAP